jgi:hypothetical protein
MDARKPVPITPPTFANWPKVRKALRLDQLGKGGSGERELIDRASRIIDELKANTEYLVRSGLDSNAGDSIRTPMFVLALRALGRDKEADDLSSKLDLHNEPETAAIAWLLKDDLRQATKLYEAAKKEFLASNPRVTPVVGVLAWLLRDDNFAETVYKSDFPERPTNEHSAIKTLLGCLIGEKDDVTISLWKVERLYGSNGPDMFMTKPDVDQIEEYVMVNLAVALIMLTFANVDIRNYVATESPMQQLRRAASQRPSQP